MKIEWVHSVFGREVGQKEEIDDNDGRLKTWLAAGLVVREGEPYPVPRKKGDPGPASETVVAATTLGEVNGDE